MSWARPNLPTLALVMGLLGSLVEAPCIAEGLLPMDSACLQDRALFETSWEVIPLTSPVTPLGEWRLPFSPSHPEKLSEARLSINLIEDPTGRWVAEIGLSFPDPKPFGIPFTFQKIELTWATANGAITTVLDWSQHCSSPGRSLYPGQNAQAKIELPNSYGMKNLVAPTVKLWGARN